MFEPENVENILYIKRKNIIAINARYIIFIRDEDDVLLINTLGDERSVFVNKILKTIETASKNFKL
jgi:hypothetical protein